MSSDFLDDELTTLRGAELFAALGDDEWARLLPRLKRLKHQAGEPVLSEGRLAPGLLVILGGRCDVLRDGRLLERIGPGAQLGVLSALGGQVSSATVQVARDGVFALLPASDLEEALSELPGLLRALGRVAARRASGTRRAGPTAPRISNLAVLCFDERAHAPTFAHNLKAGLTGASISEVVDRSFLDQEADPYGPTHAFNQLELRLDVTFTVPDPADSVWTRRCLRQADRVVLVAMADSNPRVTTLEQHVLELLDDDTDVHLVLLHPPDTTSATGTLQWLERRDLAGHLHVRLGNAQDYGRAARMLTDTAVGLVLGGASTRGIAHLGVVDAMRAADIPIDVVVGSSSGALVAGLLALEKDRDTAVQLGLTVVNAIAPRATTMGPPLVSVASGAVPSETTRRLWGDLRLEDLFLTCCFTATDLATSQLVTLDRGPVWKRARAATCLPVIWPPVIDGDRVLIDGGVLDNLPIGAIARHCERGLIFAVDLNATPGAEPLPVFQDIEPYGEVLSGWSVAWNRFAPGTRPRRYPGLADTLTYTMLLASIRHAAELERNAPPNLRLLRVALPDEGFFAVDATSGPRLIELARDAVRDEVAAHWQAHLAASTPE